jgi:hypothetical protein
MLTISEREFMDLYVRAVYLHEYDAYAKVTAESLGITYNHFARMDPFYLETWKQSGQDWPDAFPPIPENQNPPIPWATKEAFEVRLRELESGPYANLTNAKVKNQMLRESTVYETF